MPRRRPSGTPCAPPLADLGPGDLVLVACSGGADSLALAAALAFEAPAGGLRAGAVVVDHGLQPGSARSPPRPPGCLRALGLDPVDVVRVEVDDTGDGLEAAARDARYAALEAAADRHGARRRAARPHPRRPGRAGAARPRPRVGRPLPGRDAGRPRPLPPPAARRAPGAVPRASVAAEGLDLVGRPDERGPRVHPGAGPPCRRRPRARPRAGGGRGTGAHGSPAARGRRPPRRRWPTPPWPRWARSRGRSRRWPASPGPCAPGSGGGCSSRPGRRPGRWAPGTPTPATGCSPRGTGRARSRPRRPAGGPIRWSGHHRPRRSG